MDAKLIQFISLLRQGGVRITTAEDLDCANALLQTPLLDFSAFYYALRSTLIKSQRDYALFDYLFNAFFLNQQETTEQPHEKRVQQLPLLENSPLDSISKTFKSHHLTFQKHFRGKGGGSKRISPPRPPEGVEQLRELLTQFSPDERINKDLFHQLFYSSQSELDQYTQRIVREFIEFNNNDPQVALKNINWPKIRLALHKFLFKMAGALQDKEITSQLTEYALTQFQNFQNMFMIALQLRCSQTQAVPVPEKLPLMTVPFEHLDTGKARDVKRLIEQLAYKIATRISFRDKIVDRGKLHIKRTIRSSLKYGGYPIALTFKKRRITKPEIFALCDVSGSVKDTVEFFLYFLSHLSRAFSRVRSFVFVSEIDEINLRPMLLDTLDFNSILTNSQVDRYGYSDFGAAFSTFQSHYGGDLTSRTTLIIIGDARNNDNPARGDLLELWNRKVSRVIWLNPEPRFHWNTGDSIMAAYEGSCHTVVECWNLHQLTKIVNSLVFKKN